MEENEKLSPQQKKLLTRLMGQCSRREYCEADILKKAMRALENDPAAALQVLERLKRDSFVDDFRYAAAYAREKASISGWGVRKIVFSLRGKGVAAEAVDAAVEGLDQEAADARLLKVLQTKSRALKDTPDKRLKLLRFALSRGYDYDKASRIIDGLQERL